MITNTAKQRLLAGQPALGIGVGLGSPTAVALVAKAGFDFVLLDYQHGEWDDAAALATVRSVSLEGVIPMARVRQNDLATIGRALDRGMLGIVVPLVNTAEEAQAAAYAMRYPPQGGRSFAGCLAVHYGGDYGAWANREVFLAVQIESAQAVENAEAIMAVEGVDGCWIGPMDLALSMGVDVSTPKGLKAHTEAMLHVLDACRKTHKVPGSFTGSIADAQLRISQGFLFVTVNTDGGILVNGSREIMRQMRPSA